MNRREMLGTAGVGAALAAVGGTAALAQQPANDPLAACEAACNACIKAVDACFHECMMKMYDGHKEYKMLGIYCREVDEFCHITARACIRRSPNAAHAAQACIKVCEGCQQLCLPFMPKDPLMVAAHKRCLECIAACNVVVKAGL